MSYGICLFDLDGTLTDPGLGITKAFQYALARFGIEVKPDDLVRFIGPPIRESLRSIYGFSDADVEKAVAVYREYYGETGLYENTIYPDIIKILEKLRAEGKSLAVATSKATLYACKVLEHFGIDGYFSFVSGDNMDGSLTVGGKGGVIRAALDALDEARAGRPVMIGDRMYDIAGARKAGIDSIGVTWGYGSRDELIAEGATWIADSADELLRLVI